MANDTDLFAPPTDDEMTLFAPPSKEEIEETRPSLSEKVLKNIKKSVQVSVPDTQGALDAGSDLLNSGIDTARGLGQGMTFGAADEIGGAISAGIESLYNKFDPTNRELEAQGFDVQNPELSDLYRQNQQAIQKEFEGSSERSPWLYTGGQIAGGVTSGGALGGLLKGTKAATAAPKLLDIARNEGKLKALGELGLRGGKSYLNALPAIVGESALSSREGGLLNPEERSKLTEDVVGGALFGLPTVMGLHGLSEAGIPLAEQSANKLKGKLQQMVEETPLLRQMKIAHGYGTQGINPKSQEAMLNTNLGGTALSELDNQRSSKLMNEIYQAEERVGQGVRNSLESATSAGKAVDIGPDILHSLNQVQTLALKYPEIQNNPRAAQIFNKIAQGQSKVTPLEAKDLIDYMDAYIGKFKSSTNTTPAEQGILSNLYQTRQQFSNTLKIAIPEYAQAAERYSQFRKLIPETIIAGERPVNVVQGEGFKRITDEDRKLFDQLKKLNQGTTREGEAAQPVKESFVNAIKGLKTFEQQEAGRFAQGQITQPALTRTASDIEKEILKNSDDAVARGAIDALQPSAGAGTTLSKAITGVGGTGRSMSLSAANLAGRAQNKISNSTTANPISKIVKGVYSAPDDSILALSQKLKSVPGLSKYGQSLEDALNSTDSRRRNQVLFTIMQNPNARLFVKDDQELSQELEPQQ